uniref:Triple gene block protein n=1 Tax=Hydrangea ringspot virus TaxID=112228 RepID=D8UY83_9VIRU|nr:triple gene block protein [Hydrangea ringspot virus]
MSSPLRLTPPPDPTKALIPAVVGFSVAAAIFLLTRSTLPHTGDNIHSLPHGGRYRDGTKSVDYCSPHRDPFRPTQLHAALLVLALLALIHLSGCLHRRPRPDIPCSCPAHPPPP